MKEVTYICNMCGKKFDEFDVNNGCALWVHPKFGSKYDMSRVKADFCIDCMDKLIDMCKISPVVEGEEKKVAGDFDI